MSEKTNIATLDYLNEYDPAIGNAMTDELKRQRRNLELIASENIVSPAVMAAMGSLLTNKYAEGYPGKRYYGGCQCVDVVEEIARQRACELFGAEHANVQPHSGAQANTAVYFAMLNPGDTVMGMNLNEGGHLTHGSPVNISGKYFNFVPYGVDPETHRIDYDKVLEIAKECKPKMIVAGASAYPRIIDFAKLREIADAVGAYLMVDMAHIAGLVAAGVHPNPVPYCEFVTTTTHKTLRGPRGGLILCREEFAKQIDKAIFPGTQGGPLTVSYTHLDVYKRQTLYRVSGNSPIVAALIKAAENGKQVTVLVELKARFDEENNIQWATKLEKAGCHVIYGLTGLKTHCKICLVVRKDKDGIRRYLHMGTGNYNDSTARFYTDIGMFTCREEYGVDASSLFNVLTGYSTPPEYNKFIVAPHGMRPFFEAMIIQETENAKLGLPAKITAKVNSLVDPEIISLLYDASNAGVKIDLIVRGICCLVPGVHGFSENIRVISIVGQLLEHSRIFIFENNSNPLYYMGSADWMPRNLDRRVELVFPVEDEDIKKRVQEVITVSFKDTVNARQQLSTGVYKSVDKRGKHKTNCQKFFSKLALKAQKQAMKKTYASTVGTPIVPVEVKKEDSEQ